MIRRAVLLAVLLLALLSSCGDGADDGDGDTDTRSKVDPCSLLSLEQASEIVGVTYVKQVPDSSPLNLPTCTYNQEDPAYPFSLTVLATDNPNGFGETSAELAEGLDATQASADVPGSDDAGILTVPDDPALKIVAAQRGDRFVNVTFGGSVDVGLKLAEVVLGGTPEPGAQAKPLPKPCEALDGPAMTRILGATMTAKPAADMDAVRACGYESPSGTSATVQALRSAGELDAYWSQLPVDLEGSAQVTEVKVAGATSARLAVEALDETARAVAVAAVDDDLYSVEVTLLEGRPDDAGQRAVRALRSLLAA